MREEAGLGRREEAIGYGDGKFGEDAADLVRRDKGAGRSDEIAGEIARGQAAVRGVGMGVAEAAGIGSGGKGAAAPIGETTLAAVVRR